MAVDRRKKPDSGSSTVDVDDSVSLGLRVTAAYAWRILAVVAVIAVFFYLVVQLRYIVIPFMVAILLGALLVPLVQFLGRHGWPKWLAVTVAMLGTIAVIAGLILIVVAQVQAGFGDLQAKSGQAFDQLKALLLASPLQLTETQLNSYLEQGRASLQQDSQILWSGILSLGSTAGHVLAGFLLTLFSTIFILIDGQRIWAWFVRLFPRKSQVAIVGSGEAGWVTLTTFVKVQIFVAAVDALGIGLGAWIIGLAFGSGFPLVIPIAVAVFLGSFVPVVGALITGALAVLVALIYLGPVPALIMLGVVLLVQQVEGHVLQPLVMGTAVKVHPLAVVFAVAAGGFLAGIPGALFAVPIVAVVNEMVKYTASGEWRTNPHPTAKEILPHV